MTKASRMRLLAIFKVSRETGLEQGRIAPGKF